MKDVIEELSKRYIDTPVWEVEKYLSTEPFPYEEEVIDRLVEILAHRAASHDVVQNGVVVNTLC